jgi:histidinol-phosphate aminotransferase
MAETASLLPYIRTNLQGIPSWNPTATLPSEQSGRVHRMDLNECPYPPSPKVVAAVRAGAEAINRYPDGSCPRLSEVIAGRTGVALSRICWGTGSSELLGNAIRIAVAPGDGVVAPTPLWRRFAGVFRTVAADVAYAENKPDGGIDVDRLVGAIGNNTRIVVCVTPNNPTGLALTAEELARVIGGTPDNVLLYVDEAYYEFNIHAGGADALDLLAARKGPWLVTRTFSKAYAMAGMRLGYALCSSDAIADALRAVTGTFNVSALSEAAGLAALDDPDYTAWLLERNAAERARLVEGMRGLGLAPLSSVTNFVSVALPMPGAEVAAQMRARGIRIATWPEAGYEGFIRVSIGLAEDTDAFLAALSEILAAGAA